MFKKLTLTNKNSVNSTVPIAYAVLRNKFEDCALGYAVFCQRMARHAKGNTADHQYAFSNFFYAFYL